MNETKKSMTAEEEKELIRKAQNNDQSAMKKLLSAHRSFIYKTAHEAVSKYKNCSVEIEDLFIEGTMGLMAAIKKFDFSKGNKLLTYASWYIKQRILEFMQKEYASQNIISLDSKLKNEESFHEIIPDTRNPSLEDQYEKSNARKVFIASIMEHMKDLTEKEQKVVLLK